MREVLAPVRRPWHPCRRQRRRARPGRARRGRCANWPPTSALDVAVGHVEGDDLLPRLGDLRAAGHAFAHLDTGQPLADLRGPALSPRTPTSAAGASPRRCGAAPQVVVTGRVTDARLVVGPAAAHFGWARDDWDRLAGAVVAGHAIECGTQATGGNYAFFTEVPGVEHPGFPIAEVHADGSSVITKHAGTGGRVDVGTVTAQLLYEIGGPALPQPGRHRPLRHHRPRRRSAPDRVRIAGVRGTPPPPTSKVCVNALGGFRNRRDVRAHRAGDRGEGRPRPAPTRPRCSAPRPLDLVDWRLVRARPRRRRRQRRGDRDLTLHGPPPRPGARSVARFAGACVELGLASYPGFTVDRAAGDAEPFGRYWPALVPADVVDEVAVLPDGTREVPDRQTGAAPRRRPRRRPRGHAAPPTPSPAPAPDAGRRADAAAAARYAGRGAFSGDKGGTRTSACGSATRPTTRGCSGSPAPPTPSGRCCPRRPSCPSRSTTCPTCRGQRRRPRPARRRGRLARRDPTRRPRGWASTCASRLGRRAGARPPRRGSARRPVARPARRCRSAARCRRRTAGRAGRGSRPRRGRERLASDATVATRCARSSVEQELPRRPRQLPSPGGQPPRALGGPFDRRGRRARCRRRRGAAPSRWNSAEGSSTGVRVQRDGVEVAARREQPPGQVELVDDHVFDAAAGRPAGRAAAGRGRGHAGGAAAKGSRSMIAPAARWTAATCWHSGRPRSQVHDGSRSSRRGSSRTPSRPRGPPPRPRAGRPSSSAAVNRSSSARESVASLPRRRRPARSTGSRPGTGSARSSRTIPRTTPGIDDDVARRAPTGRPCPRCTRRALAAPARRAPRATAAPTSDRRRAGRRHRARAAAHAHGRRGWRSASAGPAGWRRRAVVLVVLVGEVVGRQRHELAQLVVVEFGDPGLARLDDGVGERAACGRAASAMRSSMVPAVTSVWTVTARVWPMRWTRSVAWSSTAGFHQRSKCIDVAGPGEVQARCRRPAARRAGSGARPRPPGSGAPSRRVAAAAARRAGTAARAARARRSGGATSSSPISRNWVNTSARSSLSTISPRISVARASLPERSASRPASPCRRGRSRRAGTGPGGCRSA